MWFLRIGDGGTGARDEEGARGRGGDTGDTATRRRTCWPTAFKLAASPAIGAEFMARAGVIRIDVSDAILDELVGVLRDDFAWEAYGLMPSRKTRATTASWNALWRLGRSSSRQAIRIYSGSASITMSES